ncbi:hypothetical protein BSKO_04956 [Bryopsis sp. KO-2023]|nr:hypothetical protein BSKO_04956 [Bryopsis sp. KO-2023]
MPSDTKDKSLKKKDKEEKSKKEKSSSKDKKDKPPKDKDEKRSKDKEVKEKKSKDKDKDKSKSKEKSKDKSKKDGKDARPSSAGSAQASQPKPRKPKAPPPPKKTGYLDGIDLPPTESDEESIDEIVREETVMDVKVSEKEQKKLAEKERMAAEKALQIKAEALKDDDNVFDVSFAGQGAASTASATDVKVEKLTIRAKGKMLLDTTSLTIAYGRRYGLVGPNGMGKSTLLRMMARRQIPVPETMDVLLVEQEVVADDRLALQAVVEADVQLMELRQEEEEINEKLDSPETQDESFDADLASDRLAEIHEQLELIEADSAEARASKILHGLGFTKTMQKRTTKSFSGGWRMRISLARALYVKPTLLLLDEPTNHLDLRAVLWLEEYLQRWKKTLIVVSHDRDFLNNVTTDVIHLHDLGLHFYKGDFVMFEEMYEVKRRDINKQFEHYQKEMKKAKSTGTKSNQEKVTKTAKNKEQSRKTKNKAKGFDREADVEAAEVKVPRKWNDYVVNFHFPSPPELPPPMLQLIDAFFKYPGRDDFGMKNLNIGVDMGSRVAIVGPNGAGKSTLMNLIAGDIDPVSGESRRNRKLRVGRYAQHFVDTLMFDESPVEYLMHKYPAAGMKPEDMRAMLGRFGLSGQHHLTPICKLSGGQKSRVVFTAISLMNPHILLLDEPTNHLDMQSIDALCDAIEEFEGGVVVISHDAQLLERMCEDETRSEVWIVEDGEVEVYPGDFDDYRNELITDIKAELDED